MHRLATWVVGGAAGTGVLWLTYRVVDPSALADAQAVLLFVPVLISGALAGDAISQAVDRKCQPQSSPSDPFSGSGLATLLIVSLFVWLGSETAGVEARILSPGLLIPTVLGATQLGLGLWRHRTSCR